MRSDLRGLRCYSGEGGGDHRGKFLPEQLEDDLRTNLKRISRTRGRNWENQRKFPGFGGLALRH
jgi:hypothetical protein